MRRGYLTTEFWVTVLVSVGSVTAAGAGVLPARWAALATAVSAGAYAVARGLSKIVVPPGAGPE